METNFISDIFFSEIFCVFDVGCFENIKVLVKDYHITIKVCLSFHISVIKLIPRELSRGVILKSFFN